MALVANVIPSQIPFYNTPLDSALQFCNAQVLAATGYLNNVTPGAGPAGQIDLGASQPSGGGVGRHTQMWAVDITAATQGTQAYAFALLGSNDVAFAAGNIELLCYFDVGALAARVLPALLGTSPTIPPVNITGTLIQKPYTNLVQGITYRYIRAYMSTASGSVTVSSWLSYADVKC